MHPEKTNTTVKKKWVRKFVGFTKMRIKIKESAGLLRSVSAELLRQVLVEILKLVSIIKELEFTRMLHIDAKKFHESEFDRKALEGYKRIFVNSKIIQNACSTVLLLNYAQFPSSLQSLQRSISKVIMKTVKHCQSFNETILALAGIAIQADLLPI